jgi:hypothetical protein
MFVVAGVQAAKSFPGFAQALTEWAEKPSTPQVGAEGLLLDDDPKSPDVMADNKEWPNGFDSLEPGTRARFLKEIDRDTFLVSLESGPHRGDSARVSRSSWHPLPGR